MKKPTLKQFEPKDPQLFLWSPKQADCAIPVDPVPLTTVRVSQSCVYTVISEVAEDAIKKLTGEIRGKGEAVLRDPLTRRYFHCGLMQPHHNRPGLIVYIITKCTGCGKNMVIRAMIANLKQLS